MSLITNPGIRVINENSILSYFRDDGLYSALVLINVNQLYLIADNFHPLDYFKNFADINQISQSGEYVLYLVEN